MKDLVNTKEQWLDNVNMILSKYGFNKLDDIYVRECVQHTGGHVVVINGQRMEQPGQQIVVKNIIRFNGDGWLSDNDETNQRPFTQVVFEVSYNSDEPQHILEDCLYWDEIGLIDNYIKQIFKL
jgi:hypothetical protein